MDLVKVSIQNFLSIKEATLYLKDKGVVSIEGVNKDATGSKSNGAGKSTIINSILFACYGDAGKDLKPDKIVHQKFKRDCIVQAWLQEGDVEYVITRYRKHRKFKNAVTVEVIRDGVRKDISKGTNGETQKLIDSILGADLLTFEAACFAKQKHAVDIPGLTDKGLKDLLERALPFEDLTKAFNKATKAFEQTKAAIENLEKELSKEESKCNVLLKHQEELVTLNTQYEEQAKKKHIIIQESIDKLEDRKRKIATKLIVLSELDKKISDLGDAKTKLGVSGLGSWSSEATVYLTKYTKGLHQIEETKKLIEDPSQFLKCDSCGQPISDIETVLKTLREKLADEEKRLLEYKAKADYAVQKAEQVNKLSAQIEGLRDIRQTHIETEEAIRIIDAEISLLERQKTMEAANSHTELLSRCRAALNASETLLKEHKEKLEQNKKKQLIHAAVVQTFSPKGVRYHILETITPYLNERTNHYLHQLTDGAFSAIWSTVTKLASGEYREKFSIEVTSRDLPDIDSYGALSGGEQRKVQLACFFALQDLIASRATKNINIWCCDEVDHSLDEAGLERLARLLYEKTKVKSTILVISHNELRDWIPNYVSVVRKNNISEVFGFLNEQSS